MLSEIMLLFQLQISTGCMYRDMGVLIAICTTGLATGSCLSSMLPTRLASFVLPGIISGLLYFYSAFAVFTNPEPIGRTLLYSLALLFGILGGIQFGAVTILYPTQTSKFYFTELTGAAFAVLVVAMFVLPAIGFQLTALFFGTLNTSVFFLLIFLQKVSE